MRVLTALTYYAPHWTGLTVYARHIAEGLAGRGHMVTVLCAQHSPDLPVVDELDGVRIVRVPTAGRLSRTMLMPGLPRTAWRLLGEHDVLHVHSPMPEMAFLVGLAHRRGVAAAITHQGDVVMPAGFVNRGVQGAMNLNLASAFTRAEAVATHNADYAACSRQLAARPGRVAAIHPPALIPEPTPAGVAAWRAELAPDGGPLVGFAGRWVREKGFDVLLAAVPAVSAAVPGVRFAFAGETDVVYEDTFAHARPLLDAAGDAVRLAGLITDRQRLADFYAACDLFVLPSRTDCHPAVQIEALLCGTPLVTTDIPGARSVVGLTGMGRIVPTEDPAALAAGIAAELRNPRLRPARADVAKVYDPDAAIGAYEALLDAARAGAPSPAPPAADRWQPSAAERAALAPVLDGEADLYYRARVPRLIALLDLQPGDRVLDCGAGIGALSELVKRTHPEVTVVTADGDARRLAAGQRRGVPAEPVQVDAEQLPFPDAGFDKVLLSEVLEHVDDDRSALAELYRVLRPGGVLALSVPHARYPWRWDPVGNTRELFGIEPDRRAGPLTNQWSLHLRLYLPGELANLLTAAGFELDVVEPHTPYAAPFNHQLVYSVGKPLLEHDLLPKNLADTADRFRADAGPPGRFNPVRLAVRGLAWFGRRNDHQRGDEHRFVGIVARARKPG